MNRQKSTANAIAGKACHASDTIRVVLVNDHEAMREGLRQMLSKDESIIVVGEARDGQEALAGAKELLPDVILMDMRIKGMDGIEASRRLKEIQSSASIIMLGDNRKYLAPAIRAGVVGFLPRNIRQRDLVTAIRIIHLWRLNLFHAEGAQFALVKL